MRQAWLAAALRTLPHAAAYRLGSAAARLRPLSGDRQRRASASLRRALPDLAEDQRRRILQRAWLAAAGHRADLLSAGRLGAVELCRRLTLAGWERLAAATRPDRGALLLGVRLGCWEVACYPVGLYAGPVTVATSTGPDLTLARQRQRFRTVWVAEDDPCPRLAAALAQGLPAALVLAPADLEQAETLARLSRETGQPVVPFAGERLPRGCYRVTFGEPIAPRAAVLGDLAAAYRQWIAGWIRRRPEQVAWWDLAGSGAGG